MFAILVAAVGSEITGECSRRRAGRGVFGHALERREHARVELMAGFGGLAAEHVGRRMRVKTETSLPLSGLDMAALDRTETAHRHHRVGRASGPACRLQSVEADIFG